MSNVRIDYRPEPGPENRRKPRFGRRGLVLALPLVLSLLVLLAVLLTDASDPEDGKPGRGSTPSGAGASAGVARGEATASAALATSSVSGLPRGFPSSLPGAIEAATSFAASVYQLHFLPSADRLAYVRDAMLQPPAARVLDESAAAFRTKHRLSSSGQPLGDHQHGWTAARFTSRCHPALGAYRVEHFDTDKAEVDYWMPCVLGTVDLFGSGVDVGTRWQMGRLTMRWAAGDWRVADATRGPFTTLVAPEVLGEPATALRDRLALLGPGWEVYADATEERPAEARTRELF